MAAGYDGTIRIDTRVDAKGFNQGVGGLSAGLGKLKSVLMGVAAAAAAAFSAKMLIDFGKSSVDAASQLQSALVGLQSILDGTGQSFDKAKAFIDSYIADGLIPAANAITAYKNLAMRGYDTSQIEATMLALKDASAFGRQASLTMGQAVQSATEGLRNENSILVDNAGVTKNVSKMWEEYAKSIGTTVDKLTQAQKIQAEVNGLLEESRYQQGDAAKLADSYAGRMAALGTSFTNLKVAIGNALIPVLTQIIPYIKAVVDWFVTLAQTAARVSAILFGTSASASSLADGMGEAAASSGDLADNTKKTEKAAKGALAAFDELNVLRLDNGTDAAQTDTPAQSLGLMVSTPEQLVPDELMAKVEAFKQKLGEMFAPTFEALGRLRDALKPVGEFVAQGVVDFYNNFLKPIGEWVLGEGLPRFIDAAREGIEKVDWKRINEALANFWSKLEPFAVNVGEGLLWLWENVLVPLGTWTMNEVVPRFIDFIANVLDLVNIAIEKAKPGLKWLWENVLLPFAQFKAEQFITVMDWINQKLGELAEWFKNTDISEWFKAQIDKAKAFFQMLWDDTVLGAKVTWEGIKSAFVDIVTWFSVTVIKPVKDKFEELKESLVDIFVGARDGVQRAWNTVKDWFTDSVVNPIKDAFNTLHTFFTGLWDRIKLGFDTATDNIKSTFERAFDWIGQIAKDKLNGIIDFINAALRGYTEMINAVVRGLNSLSFTVPDWVPNLGGQSWGFNLTELSAPQIPRLATGAVIPPNSQFLAVLGDQRSGRNLEAPEGLIRQIIQEELGSIETNVKLEFGGTLGALVRELQPYISREQVRIGTSLVKGMVR